MRNFTVKLFLFLCVWSAWAGNADAQKKIAFIYDPTYTTIDTSTNFDPQTDVIFAALNGISGYTVTPVAVDVKSADDVATIPALVDTYDLVVATEALSGGQAYSNALASIVNKIPMLNLKSFHYGDNRWSWGAGVNPAAKTISITVNEAAHPIFKNLSLSDNQLQLFKEVQGTHNQVQGYSLKDATDNDKMLALASGSDVYAIHERRPVDGKNIYLMIPLSCNTSSDPTYGLTDAAIQLIKNAVDYLLNPVSVPAAVAVPAITYSQGEESCTVTISPVSGSKAYYTMDGTEPTVASTEYTQPFEFSGKACTVKAIAVKGGMSNSEVVSKAVINSGFVAYEKTVMWANFKDQPSDWWEGATSAANVDLFGSGGNTGTKTRAGFTIEAVGGKERVTILTNQNVKRPGSDEDASNIALQILDKASGAGSFYITAPDTYQAPFNVGVWFNAKKSAQSLNIYVKAENETEWRQVGKVTTSSSLDAGYAVKQSLFYDGTDKVAVRIGGTVGSGKQYQIFDIRILGKGADPKVVTDKESLSLNYPFVGILSYTRTFDANKWGTIMLPFAVTDLKGCTVQGFNSYSNNTLNFKTATSIEANVPYLIKNETGGEITFESNAAFADEPVCAPVVKGTSTFAGTYKSMEAGEATGKYVLDAANQKFAKASASATVPAFRAYFDLAGANGPAYSIGIDGGGTTGISGQQVNELSIYSVKGGIEISAAKVSSVKVYGVDGRLIRTLSVSEGSTLINDLEKGLYIVNGVKVAVK